MIHFVEVHVVCDFVLVSTQFGFVTEKSEKINLGKLIVDFWCISTK